MNYKFKTEALCSSIKSIRNVVADREVLCLTLWKWVQVNLK